MPIAPVISLPHSFETDDTPETLRLKLGEFARSVEDLFNRQVSVYVMYARSQKLPTLKKGDIVMDFSANRGFATLQQWDGRKLVPLSIASTSIIGLVNLITQGTGSGTDPTLFLRSDGANNWVLDHVNLLTSGKGSGIDPTKYLRSDGTGGWVLDLPAGGGGGTTWFNGSGVPSGGLGANGDYYIDNDTGNVYFKSGGTWSLIFNMRGGSTISTVSGTQNGVNLVFTLSPAATGTVLVFLNGQLLTSGIDYNLTTSTTLTFISPTIPVAGDIITVISYAGAAPMSIRSIFSLSSAALAANAQQTGNTSILGKTFDIIKVVSSNTHACRVRLYASSAAMTADLTRDRYTPPSAGAQHQVIMDLVLTDTTGYTWVMSPLARGSNPVGAAIIYFTLDNLDSVIRTLQFDLTYLTNEA